MAMGCCPDGKTYRRLNAIHLLMIGVSYEHVRKRLSSRNLPANHRPPRFMNATFRTTLIVGSLLGLLPLHAQDETKTVDEPVSSAVTIVGDLPDGTPPPPAPPRPRVVFQPEDILQTRVKDLGDRIVTFQKVAPIELPPIPEPVPPAPITDPAALALLAEMRQNYKESRFLFVGATTYVLDREAETFRTQVRYWAQGKREPIEFWVNANFLWLGGFADFETAEARYSLLMAMSEIDVGRRAEVYQRFGHLIEIPEMPLFEDDSKASFVLVSGNPDEEELAPIRSLLELYNSDKDRLRLAYEGRKEAAEERARELRENPPEKKDLRIRYWRLDDAGTRGITSKPATIR